jgi:hypothetical protein
MKWVNIWQSVFDRKAAKDLVDQFLIDRADE